MSAQGAPGRIGAVWFALAFVPLVAWIKDASVVALIGSGLLVLAEPNLRKNALAPMGGEIFAGAAFLAWALAAVAWSPAHDPTDWLKAVPVIAAAALTVRALAAAPELFALRLTGPMILAIFALFTLLLEERATGGFFIGTVRAGDSTERLFDIMSPGLALLSCLVFPVALILETLSAKKAVGWALIGACFLMALSYRMDAAPMALAAGAMAYGIVYRLKQRGLVLVSAGIALLALSWGTLASLAWTNGEHTWLTSHINLNWGFRVEIWHRVQELIGARPWFGYGFDTARLLAQGPGIVFLHPHNGLLQVWLELGLVGVVLFLAWCAAMIRKTLASVQASAALATVAATLTALLVFWLVSFGIWQGWWLAAIGLVLSALSLALRVAAVSLSPRP